MKTKNHDGWCFAIINKRLAEIYFSEKHGIWSHCYVKPEKYTTKQEKKWIKEDTERNQFSFRKGYYLDKIQGIKQKVPKKENVFPEIIFARSNPS